MSLPQLAEALRRNWRLFLTIFIVAFGAVAAVTFLLPKVYEARATLVVGENRSLTQGGNLVELDETLARTYSELLKTPSAESEVLRALPFEISDDDLANRITFEAVSSTKLLLITATDGNAERAQAIANTYASTFVGAQQRSATAAGQEALQELSRRIGELALDVRELEARSDLRSRAELERSRAELEAVRGSYNATQQGLAVQGTNISIASLARVPDSPARPRPTLYLASGALLALGLALGGLLLRDSFDKRIRDEDELVELMGAPVLARIPRESPSGPRSRWMGESFQVLRSNLQFQDRQLDIRSIAITSALPREGKTLVVARLSTALGLVGARVAAVDCDLRRPTLHTLFGVDGAQGLANVLMGSAGAEELISVTANSNVRLLPAGPNPPDPAVLLSTLSFSRTLDELRASADYIVCDTPPVTVGADASSVAAAVDGVIMVVDLSMARRDTLRAAREQLEKSGSPLIGLVLNRITTGMISYDAYSPVPPPNPNDGSRVRNPPSPVGR